MQLWRENQGKRRLQDMKVSNEQQDYERFLEFWRIATKPKLSDPETTSILPKVKVLRNGSPREGWKKIRELEKKNGNDLKAIWKEIKELASKT